MEIIGIDGHLVVNSGETVGFSDTVGYERGVVEPLWEVTFIAGEQKYMFEIDVTRFQYTHYLDAFDWFPVEGYTGGRNNLCDESL